MSNFASVGYVELPAVFALSARCSEDPNTDKVNLTVGAYRTEQGKPWVLPCVKKAESMLAADDTLNKEYLSMGGLQSFTDASTRLVMGENNPAIQEDRAVAIQTLSGTGAIHVALQFVKRFWDGCTEVYVSNPSWGNHKLMIDKLDGVTYKPYTYYDSKTMSVDIEGMCRDLEAASDRSVVLLHACAHNPTGIDPTQEQWGRIAELCKKKGHLPIFDIAYQGYASGSFDVDAYSIRLFLSQGFSTLVCQSFAKIMGLYCERIGCLMFVGDTAEIAHKCLSQLKIIVRAIYSNPPAHGARVASMCLNNRDLRQEWEECVREMHARIRRSRTYLHTALLTCNVPGNWDHILSQNGMFTYTGLTKGQCELLIEKHHIYLLKSGRISMCGVTKENARYVAEAVKDALENAKEN